MTATDFLQINAASVLQSLQTSWLAVWALLDRVGGEKTTTLAVADF